MEESLEHPHTSETETEREREVYSTVTFNPIPYSIVQPTIASSLRVKFKFSYHYFYFILYNNVWLIFPCLHLPPPGLVPNQTSLYNCLMRCKCTKYRAVRQDGDARLGGVWKDVCRNRTEDSRKNEGVIRNRSIRCDAMLLYPFKWQMRHNNITAKEQHRSISIQEAFPFILVYVYARQMAGRVCLCLSSCNNNEMKEN